MFKSFNKLEEENFIVLRGPLESNRQSPNGIAGALYHINDYFPFPFIRLMLL